MLKVINKSLKVCIIKIRDASDSKFFFIFWQYLFFGNINIMIIY